MMTEISAIPVVARCVNSMIVAICAACGTTTPLHNGQ
jgi:hypothetical protein